MPNIRLTISISDKSFSIDVQSHLSFNDYKEEINSAMKVLSPTENFKLSYGGTFHPLDDNTSFEDLGFEDGAMIEALSSVPEPKTASEEIEEDEYTPLPKVYYEIESSPRFLTLPPDRETNDKTPNLSPSVTKNSTPG